jgi:ABC-type sugar transport system substrate-binding protein
MLVVITIITLLASCAAPATQTPEVGTKVVTETVTLEPTLSVEEVLATNTPTVAGEEEPTIYHPVLRLAAKKWRIGYTDGGASYDVSKIRWKSIQDAAAEAGVEMVYCDNAWPDTEQHIRCAEMMVSQKVDLVISSSWIAELNDRLMEIYNEANIPVIGWDVTHNGNRSYYGIDTWTAGVLAGDYAGKWALKNCQIDQVDIVLLKDPDVGSFPLQKLSGFVAGVRHWLPGIPPERVYEVISIEASDTFDSTTAWLTAHPDSHCVLITAVNNYSAGGGASAAFTLAGRVKDGCIVGQGADAPMFTEFVTPENESAFKASVSDSPWKDGYALIPMAVDILEGVDVPPISLKEHEVITRENVDQMVPTEYQAWP